MADAKGSDFKSIMSQLDATLEEYLVKKAPAIPANIREIIVKIAPWLTLLGVIMSIPAILAVLGLGAMMAPLAFLGGMGAGAAFSISIVFVAITIILEALAIPGLFSRSRKGWDLLFYSALVSAVSSIVTFNIGGLIIGTLLTLYIMYQIKGYYK
ncbi:MAG: chromate transporter [bacterium]|nr:chromate transporter [bacterium]